MVLDFWYDVWRLRYHNYKIYQWVLSKSTVALWPQSESNLVLRTPPPPGFFNGGCTQNHTVQKYNSYRVNFWPKISVYQERISRIILWKLLFLSQLYHEKSSTIDIAYNMKKRFLVMYYLIFPKKQSARTTCTYIRIESDHHMRDAMILSFLP